MADQKPSDAFFENSASAEIQPVGADAAGDHDLDKPQPPPRVELTEEDNKRICRKTDKTILVVLVWVYFLQILDKSVLGYGAIYGMKEDTGLTGNQYSFVGSVASVAQLAWQPLSSWLIVKVPHRWLMPALVLGWGIAQTCMAFAFNYPGLVAARFFLGLFEGGCLPLFSVMTSQWYRRAEQPLRVAAWYSTNGWGTMVAAALSYGFGQITNGALASWQIIFLFVGLVTVCTAPWCLWQVDNGIDSARFLDEKEKEQCVERLRANQTGVGSTEFKWAHVIEVALEPKTYLWIGITICLNTGSAVQNVFGPTLLAGLGYDSEETALLNIPFGFLQFSIILFASYAAQKFRLKSLIFNLLLIPVIVGLALLYTLDRTPANEGPLLLGYYLLAFLFGGNPLLVTWIVGNTGGQTKKSVIMACYAASSAAGNIMGPLLFSEDQAPEYLKGLLAVLGIFIALICLNMLQVANLFVLNKLNRRSRIRNGKKADLKDHSMAATYVAPAAADAEDAAAPAPLAGAEDLDLTDGKNDEFIYIF